MGEKIRNLLAKKAILLFFNFSKKQKKKKIRKDLNCCLQLTGSIVTEVQDDCSG